MKLTIKITPEEAIEAWKKQNTHLMVDNTVVEIENTSIIDTRGPGGAGGCTTGYRPIPCDDFIGIIKG